ncbi:MAG: hypothetical protein FWD47_13505 [Treponema sp.]|nr:hypothetical protein [Treponema sp.]
MNKFPVNVHLAENAAAKAKKMKQLKSKTIAVTLFTVFSLYCPVFSQETRVETLAKSEKTLYMPPKKNMHRFDVLSSFSYYPAKTDRINFQTEGYGPAAPAEYERDHSFNLNMQMGMKLFKEWQAYVDFGIKEKNAQRMIDIMGKLGPRYFYIEVDYTQNNGKIHLWEDMPFGDAALEAIKSRPADSLVEYNQTWMSVALMFTPHYAWRIINKIGNFEENDKKREKEVEQGQRKFHISPANDSYYLGLFYNHTTIPFLATSHFTLVTDADGKDMEVPADDAITEFEPAVPLWALGVRFGYGRDHNSSFRVSSPPGGFNLLMTNVFDLGLGKGKPDSEIVERMRTQNKNFKDSFTCLYVGIKINMGLFREFTVLKDNIILLSGGYGFNYQRYLLANFFDYKYYLLTDVGLNHGPFVQLGLRF